jgi:hypothetical protein
VRCVDAKYKYYLYDLGYLLKERALQSKADRDSLTVRDENYHFQSGRLLAFNEVLSIVQQMAEGFDIPLEDLKLEGLDPDRDLT